MRRLGIALWNHRNTLSLRTLVTLVFEYKGTGKQEKCLFKSCIQLSLSLPAFPFIFSFSLSILLSPLLPLSPTTSLSQISIAIYNSPKKCFGAGKNLILNNSSRLIPKILTFLSALAFIMEWKILLNSHIYFYNKIIQLLILVPTFYDILIIYSLLEFLGFLKCFSSSR